MSYDPTNFNPNDYPYDMYDLAEELEGIVLDYAALERLRKRGYLEFEDNQRRVNDDEY